MYDIHEYSFDQAKKLGVTIKPSTKRNKKIDVYKDGKYICSIGHIDYGDFPHFYEDYGAEFACERREAYHKRHAKDNVEGTPGYYALNILW
jgi:hypothetical protein